MSAISIEEEFEIAILNLLQDERIYVLIDGKTLTGKDALKIHYKELIKKGKFGYRERRQDVITKVI